MIRNILSIVNDRYFIAHYTSLEENQTDFLLVSQKELIDPAVKGTVNVLKSCKKAESVERVVITSSMASVMFNYNPVNSDVVVDETWFSDTDFCKENKV